MFYSVMMRALAFRRAWRPAASVLWARNDAVPPVIDWIFSEEQHEVIGAVYKVDLLGVDHQQRRVLVVEEEAVIGLLEPAPDIPA